MSECSLIKFEKVDASFDEQTIFATEKTNNNMCALNESFFFDSSSLKFKASIKTTTINNSKKSFSYNPDGGENGSITIEDKSTFSLTQAQKELVEASIATLTARVLRSEDCLMVLEKLSVKRLITTVNISNNYQGTQYAHDQLIKSSVFKGKLVVFNYSEDFRLTSKKCDDIEIIEKSIEKSNNSIYVKFYNNGKPYSVDKHLFDEVINEECKLLQGILPELDTTKLDSGEDQKSSAETRFRLIALSDYMRFKRKPDDKEEKTIYRIGNNNDLFYIETGLYSGLINFISGDKKKNKKLEIRTEYSDKLFQRMLLHCCGIYTDSMASDETSDNDRSVYSLLAQYLYIVSLGKVMGKMIPRKYIYPNGRGYDIKGNVDINAYINKDLSSFDKKITYVYPERVDIIKILNVLYAALKCCKLSNRNALLPKLHSFEVFLKENCSGKRPTRREVNDILKEKCLRYGLFTDYRRPLELAKVILQNKDTAPGDDSENSGVSGYLIDTSFLWEMYLYNLMSRKLDGWDVNAQATINYYEKKFYGKPNYPDFIVSNHDSVFVFDAKFKHMEYRPKDVDNKDIQQVHAYSYYYHLKEGERFKGTALIYPSQKEKPQTDEYYTSSSMFGLEGCKERFTIFAFKDNPDDLDNSERNLIESIRSFINDHA